MKSFKDTTAGKKWLSVANEVGTLSPSEIEPLFPCKKISYIYEHKNYKSKVLDILTYEEFLEYSPTNPDREECPVDSELYSLTYDDGSIIYIASVGIDIWDEGEWLVSDDFVIYGVKGMASQYQHFNFNIQSNEIEIDLQKDERLKPLWENVKNIDFTNSPRFTTYLITYNDDTVLKLEKTIGGYVGKEMTFVDDMVSVKATDYTCHMLK